MVAAGAVLTFVVWSPGVHAAIAFRGAAQTTAPNATTVTVPVPAGTVKGDVMIAIVGAKAESQTTVMAPAGWTVVLSNSDPANFMTVTSYKRVASAEPVSYIWTINVASSVHAAIFSYSGVDTSNPVDTSGGTVGSAETTTPTSPSITTTVGKAWVISLFVAGDPLTTITAPSGYASRQTSLANLGAGHADKALSSPPGATGPAVWTMDPATNWIAQQIAIRPAASATP